VIPPLQHLCWSAENSFLDIRFDDLVSTNVKSIYNSLASLTWSLQKLPDMNETDYRYARRCRSQSRGLESMKCNRQRLVETKKPTIDIIGHAASWYRLVCPPVAAGYVVLTPKTFQSASQIRRNAGRLVVAAAAAAVFGREDATKVVVLHWSH